MTSSNFTLKNQNWKNVILLLFSFGLLLYTSLRANWLSLTCDEASTYLSHVPNSVFNCFFSENCWSDANNHLLNTLFMQFSVSAFGVSELTLRLPNLFGHFLYLIFSILLIQRFSKNNWIALAGFCLLNLNPFLVEFFSLARGYGLGIGWMIMSIYFLFRWIENEKWITGMYCFLGAVLAVLSNFVFLNYWVSLSTVFGFFLLKKYLLEKPSMGKKTFYKNWIPLFSAGLLLFFLLKNPIQYLGEKGEFVFGLENFAESYVELMKVSLMSQGYFNPFTTNVFILLSLILLGFSTFFGMRNLGKNYLGDNLPDGQAGFKLSPKLFTQVHFSAISLMLLVILATVVQHHLLDVKYLQGRKAIIFLPFFGLSVYMLLEFLFQNKKIKIAIGLSILISVFSFLHFYRTSDFQETVEWKYDSQTKNMVTYLQNNFSSKKDLQLGVYWIFGPATDFYQEHLVVEQIGKIVRLNEEDLKEKKELDFIYVEKKDASKISKDFILEKEFGEIGALFRNPTFQVGH